MGFTVANTYNKLFYMVEPEDLKANPDISLHDFLKDIVGISSNQIRDFKRQKLLYVNGIKMSINSSVKAGHLISAEFAESEHFIFPEDIPIDICYEDIDVICVNKDRDMVAHPTKGHPKHTMSNALMHHALTNGETYKPRLINRLDMNTTGIMLFGKNPYAQHCISAQMAENQVKKTYLAIVQGHLSNESGIIDNYIYKTDDGIKRAVSEDNSLGKRCITHYKVIAGYPQYSLVELDLKTGRTHQIRVHMSFLGNPILGDILYGANEKLSNQYNISRQLLHSYKLQFKSPRVGYVKVIADIPNDMKKLIN